MSNNLDLYNKVREVPKEAKKPIEGGRLNGMTDINPMWRIKTLTERFGPCGFGWRYEIADRVLTQVENGEIVVTMFVNLYIKADGEWSFAIPGIGSNKIVEKETKGNRTNDEGDKMALTDALSVACKALGVGASVYWERDNTKYSKQSEPAPQPKKGQPLRDAAKTILDPKAEARKELNRIKAKLEVTDKDFETACNSVKAIGADLVNFWRSCEDDNLTPSDVLDRADDYQSYLDNLHGVLA